MKKILTGIAVLIAAAALCFAANEITTVITFQVIKGSLNFSRNVNLQFTLSAPTPQTAGVTQIIPTNPTLITVGDVQTNGWAYFRNLATTNYVEIGSWDTTNFRALVRMNTNEPALFRLAQGISIYGRANVAPVTIEKFIVDN
jgi:hypothetical protein